MSQPSGNEMKDQKPKFFSTDTSTIRNTLKTVFQWCGRRVQEHSRWLIGKPPEIRTTAEGIATSGPKFLPGCLMHAGIITALYCGAVVIEFFRCVSDHKGVGEDWSLLICPFMAALLSFVFVPYLGVVATVIQLIMAWRRGVDDKFKNTLFALLAIWIMLSVVSFPLISREVRF
jgi:hypothetical protein